MGTMERLFREFDWSTTPIGPPERWPVTWRNAARIILDSSSPIAIGFGPELVYFYNDAFIPVGGPARHPSALGQPVKVAWREIWPDILQPRLAQTLTTGEPTGEADLLMPLRRSGYLEETYISFSFAALRDDGGQPSGIFCTATDNTQRVIAERHIDGLRRLASQSAFVGSPEAACKAAAAVLEDQGRDVPFALLYLFDASGRRAELAGFCGLRELPAGIPRSARIDSGLDPWRLSAVSAQHAPALIDDIAVLLGSALRRKDWVPRQALALPIAGGGSERPAGVLVAGANPMRPLEESRAFHLLVAQQLETVIANARAKQHIERRAEELAELDRAKTVFFGNVSHELRTPLTLLLGPVEQVLANSRLDDPDRERLETAQRAGRRLLKLVNSLLAFSRMEADRIDAHYEPIDLARLTTDLASMFRSVFERASVTLTVACPPLPEAIYVDRDSWERIVLNLVSNAFKFTYSGEVRVSQRLKGDCVELEVADTGCGIAEEDLPHLFERFFRGDVTQARSVEGAGIGLSLVRELVKLHGGSVQARSTVGAGTTLTVRIPRGSAHLPAGRIATRRAPAPPESGASPYVEEALAWIAETGGKGSWDPRPPQTAPLDTRSRSGEVLVVDDNADMRAYLSRLLETRWRVSAASDGRAALKQIEEHPPDLVVADIMMPGLDGLELARALRGKPATREIPLVLVSARAGEQPSCEGLAAGADDYLAKPFSARELIARIEARLAQAKACAAQRQAREAAEQAGRARDDFIATVFHELRTPLASVQTWVQLLKSNRVPETDVPTALETLEASTRSLYGLVYDLLDYAAVVRGELRVEPRVVASVAPVIDLVVQAFQPVAQTKHVTLSCHIQGHCGPANVDSLRLQQVVWNLISNAIRHTPSGGQVEVACRHRAAEIEITVRDTGCGIEPQDLPYVFDRYWSGKSGRARYHGLGLGLAIVGRIVELHGGTIRADSRGVDCGATFTVRLPVSHEGLADDCDARAADEAAARLLHAVSTAADGAGREVLESGPQALETLEGVPQAHRQALRILLVEDDDGLARACQRLLASHGHSIMRAKGCSGALHAVKRATVDLILSDVCLLDGDAFELLGQVRALLDRPAGDDRQPLPAVAMSAVLGQKEAARCRAAGFAAQISKPFQESALLRALQKASQHGPLTRVPRG